MQASVLDNIYFQARFSELLNCVDLFLAQTPAYELTDADTIADIIKSVRDGNETVNRQLFDIYCRNLRKAVDSVRNRDELADLLRANISQFAAYKAYQVTRQIRSANDDDEARATINRFNRYQTAEYNTTISRCRTAKQFDKFVDDERRRLFPNLRWLPSRSATPRPEHQQFWNKVWSKDDPFWSTNQPGCLWNCGCDWEETDDDVTAGNPTNDDNAPGIGLNPATTGEVFNTPEACRKFNDANGRTEKNEVLPHPYFKISKTKERQLESYVGDKVLRKECISSLKKSQGNTVSVDLQGKSIDVLFDSKTTSHISNDIASHCDFLANEFSKDIEKRLKSAKLVAHEVNTKLDKKPSAVHYYYYQYEIGNKTYYFNVEENVVRMENNRRFYRLYALTVDIRDTAILY